MDIDFLERSNGAPLRYRLNGTTYDTPDPVKVPYASIWNLASSGMMPGPAMSFLQSRRLVDAWLLRHGLPDAPSIQRLAWLMEKYAAEISYDLRVHCGVDLGEMWRSRRWAELLNLIDRLPAHAHYSAAVANDDEHAKMLAEALERQAAARGGEPQDPGPSLTGWTPEVAAIKEVQSDLRHLIDVTIASNHGGKGSKPQQSPPVKFPVTALMRARKDAGHSARQEKHRALTERLLPHKRVSVES